MFNKRNNIIKAHARSYTQSKSSSKKFIINALKQNFSVGINSRLENTMMWIIV